MHRPTAQLIASEASTNALFFTLLSPKRNTIFSRITKIGIVFDQALSPHDD